MSEEKTTRSPIGKFLSRAGVLIVLGLVIQALTLVWSHPTAFLVFAGIGFSLVALGIVLYLWAILRAQPQGKVAAES